MSACMLLCLVVHARYTCLSCLTMQRVRRYDDNDDDDDDHRPRVKTDRCSSQTKHRRVLDSTVRL